MGQRREEGEALSWLAHILSRYTGRSTESQRAMEQAVALLETLPPGRELTKFLMVNYPRRKSRMLSTSP